jgi:hypothetical protein
MLAAWNSCSSTTDVATPTPDDVDAFCAKLVEEFRDGHAG